MKKLLLFSAVLLSQIGVAQSKVEVFEDEYSRFYYKNLDSKIKEYKVDRLESSKNDHVRIWKANELFDLGSNPKYIVHYKNFTTNKTYVFEHKIPKVSLNALNIEKLKGYTNKHAIDAIPIHIEISESGNYFARVFSVNDQINQTLRGLITEEIKSKHNQFLTNLPSGKYNRMIEINQPIKEENIKSDFYLKLESELSKNNINISNPLKQPRIVLNGKEVFFKDINSLKMSDVKDYKVYDNKYSMNGLVIIRTI